MKIYNVLVADDDSVNRELITEVLTREGYRVQVAENAESAELMVRENHPEIVISDIRMGGDRDGLLLLKKLKSVSPNVEIVLMTGFGSVEGAVEALRLGAFDYISKPFQLTELVQLVKKTAQHWQLKNVKSGVRPLEKDSGNRPNVSASRTLTGKSPRIVEVYKTVARAALSDSTVLVLGESGTGKELVARALHENSNRSHKNFVAINCGALTENLLESELFGYMKGAFTGANQDKSGLFAEAEGGTLFLDEIGDISTTLQIKLLRVLQESEYKPVGSVTARKANVRIVTATHRDLSTLVKEGKFREDLLYRLRVVQIELPPLRERIEDLPELVDTFLVKYSGRIKKTVSHVAPEAMELLMSYSWPGNVRELEHMIERAIVLSRSSILYLDDFSMEGVSRAKPVLAEPELPHAAGKSLEAVEKDHIQRVLRETGFNRSRSAEILGIDRATLYRKAVKFGISM